MKVLLIEELPGANAALVRALSGEGAAVQEAEIGPPAVARAAEFDPDLILIDASVVDGATLGMAATLGWVHGVPIVFLVSSPARGQSALLVQLPWARAVVSKSSGMRPLLEIVAETARSAARIEA